MDFNHKTINELVDLALSTMNLKEMFLLQNNPSMNVRRALAKNRNIPVEIVEKLENDPVENVSYLAYQHPKSRNSKTYECIRPCVTCTKDERGLNCINCSEIREHSF